jgi:hypothetical protein
MSEEELLRINGSNPQIQKIKQDADNGKSAWMERGRESLINYFFQGKNVQFSSPSVAASVLKLYLKFVNCQFISINLFNFISLGKCQKPYLQK